MAGPFREPPLRRRYVDCSGPSSLDLLLGPQLLREARGLLKFLLRSFRLLLGSQHGRFLIPDHLAAELPRCRWVAGQMLNSAVRM